MGSLHCGVQPSQTILGFHYPILKVTNFSFNQAHSASPLASYRFKNGVILQVSPKFNQNVVVASSKNPAKGSDVVEERENSRAKGPPFLTILAGLLVFAAVSWVIGSIVLWLVGLVFNLLQTK